MELFVLPCSESLFVGVSQYVQDAPKFTSTTYQLALGRKRYGDFAALCSFFNEEYDRLGGDGVIQQYAPSLLPGLVGALTHGIIHLGWALDARSRWMTVEGLAYMVYCSLSVHPERFVHGKHDEGSPLESLQRVADGFHQEGIHDWVEEVKALDKYSEGSGFRSELVPAGFQWHLAKVLEEGHPMFLELPTWLDTLDYDDILEQMYKAVTVLYLSTTGQPEAPQKPGNFFVLHLVTSLWALEKVLLKLPDADRRAGLKCFWSGMLGLIFTSGDFPTSNQIAAIAEKFGNAQDGDACAVADGEEWAQIVPRAMAEEEEHNIKLAYVARELWRRYNGWSGFRVGASSFTETPNTGCSKTSLKA